MKFNEGLLGAVVFCLGVIMGIFFGFEIHQQAVIDDCSLVGFTRIDGIVYQCSIAGEKE